MELFTFTHYLKNHKIIKELPIPSFVPKINEEENNKYMKELYKIPKEKYTLENIKENKISKNRFKKIVKKEIEEEDEKEIDIIENNLKELTFENFNKHHYQPQNNYESKNRITNTSLWDSNQSSISN